MSEQQEDEAVKARYRAESNGVVWLNSFFTRSYGRVNVGIRMSASEAFWSVVAFLGGWLLLYLISLPFTIFSSLNWITSPVTSFILALVGAFLWGRNLAHISSLSRQTGEGTTAWLYLKLKGLKVRLLSLVGISPAVYNIKQTRFRGRIRDVEAIEWLGTRRARRAPRYNSSVQEKRIDPRTGMAHSPLYMRNTGQDMALRSMDFYVTENQQLNGNVRLKAIERGALFEDYMDVYGEYPNKKKRKEIIRKYRQALRKQSSRGREQKVAA